MLKLSYLLTNRGRANNNILPVILNEIENNKHFIIVLDESDATDADKGLDGREIFELVRKNSQRDDIEIIVHNDLDVGAGFITSKSVYTIQNKEEQINKWDLKFPQGSSEKYKHFRVLLKLAFNDELNETLGMPGINLVVQHNSAFLRPFRRALQSLKGMLILKALQLEHKDMISVLLRDQNTMLPGEGTVEKILRKIHKVDSLTDNLDREYHIETLESDTGGLNAFWMMLYKFGIVDFISKYIFKPMNKVETISIIKGNKQNFGLKLTPSHQDIEGLDHGMLSIMINK